MAMKNFLIYIVALVLSVLIFLVVGEILARHYPNPYKYKDHWMETHKGDVETLVLGGSQTFYGVRPDLLDGIAFNLANVSQGLEYDLWLLKKYECPKLKTVIIPISYPTLFSDKLEDGEEWYRIIYYRLYMGVGNPNHSIFSKYNYEFCYWRSFQDKITKVLFKHSNSGYDDLGWGNTYKLRAKNNESWDSGSEASVAIERHTHTDFSNLNKNEQYLREIAKECIKQNITLVLITPPCWKLYNEMMDEKQYNKMKDVVRNIEEEYGVVYFDYLQDNRFGADDFYDSNHLTEYGAEKFSIILNEDLNGLR